MAKRRLYFDIFMKKAITFIVLGVVVVLSLTIATYIVLMQLDPDLEVRKMMIAMSDLETVKQDSGFSWTRGEGVERINTTLFATGQISIDDQFDLKHATQFRVVHIGATDEYSDLSGELRTLGDASYLTYTPPGPNVDGMSFDQDQTWVSFENDELLSWGSILPGLDLPIQFQEKNSSWTAEGYERLRYLLKIADIFIAESSGLTQIVGGANTLIIDARLDPDVTETFLGDIVRAKQGRDINEEERVLAGEQAKQISRLTFRFWIGTQDHLLYKLQAAGSFLDPDTNDLIPVDIKMEFEDFNEPFTGKAPNEPLLFEDVLRSAFSSLPDSSALTLDASDRVLVSDEIAKLPVEEVTELSDPDEDGLSNALESFYGTNPNDPDTDGDGVTDGDEVRNGHNPRGTGSLFGFGLDR